MSFFKDIKNQSLAVRQIMFGLCVVTTVSLVGMVWYRSFETKLYVLMDRQPQTDTQSVFFAKDNNSPGLFASLSGALGNMKTAVLDLFSVFDSKSNTSDGEVFKGKAYQLPLSGDK